MKNSTSSSLSLLYSHKDTKSIENQIQLKNTFLSKEDQSVSISSESSTSSTAITLPIVNTDPLISPNTVDSHLSPLKNNININYSSIDNSISIQPASVKNKAITSIHTLEKNLSSDNETVNQLISPNSDTINSASVSNNLYYSKLIKHGSSETLTDNVVEFSELITNNSKNSLESLIDNINGSLELHNDNIKNKIPNESLSQESHKNYSDIDLEINSKIVDLSSPFNDTEIKQEKDDSLGLHINYSQNSLESNLKKTPQNYNEKLTQNVDAPITTHDISILNNSDFSNSISLKDNSIVSISSDTSVKSSKSNMISNYRPFTEAPVSSSLYPSSVHLLPPNVLSEDDYINCLADIIERDYFPNLKKYRALKEGRTINDPSFLESTPALSSYLNHRNHLNSSCLYMSSEPLTPHNISENNSNRTNLLQTEKYIHSPFPDNQNLPLVDDIKSERSYSGGKTSNTYNPSFSSIAPDYNENSNFQLVELANGQLHHVNINYNLDTFQSLYTSEDNASYEHLAENEKEQKRKKANWMLKTEADHNEMLVNVHKNTLLGLKTETLATNQYTARNNLMFYPSPLPQSSSTSSSLALIQSSSLLKSSPSSSTLAFGGVLPPPFSSSIDFLEASNTRFKNLEKQRELLMIKGLAKRHRMEEAEADELSRDDQIQKGYFNNLEGAITTTTAAGGVPSLYNPDPSAQAYNYVHTPVLLPGMGADQSPLMTWGKVASTPLLLDTGDKGDIDINTHSFQIPELMPREKAAEKLQNSASQKARNKRKSSHGGSLKNFIKQELLTPLSSTPINTPQHSYKISNRLHTLAGKSPLVKQMINHTKANVDLQLRVAYSKRKNTGFLSSSLSTPIPPSPLNTPYRYKSTSLPNFSNTPVIAPKNSVSDSYMSDSSSKGVAYTERHIFKSKKQNIEISTQSEDRQTNQTNTKALTDNLLNL